MESAAPELVVPQSTRPTVLSCEGVGKVFVRDKSYTKVLHSVNLTVREGEFLIVTGQSGSGKTSLLNIIGGLEPPTSGKVEVKGQDIFALTDDQRATFRATRFGIVYQQFNWVRALNVVHNVALPLLSVGMGLAKAEQQAFATLQRFGLEDFAKQNPLELSGGEQQRVSIARAIVHDPWLIIADEPTGSLDTHSADNVMGLLSQLNANEGRTVIMVTHNPGYDMYGSHRIEIRDGTIIKDDYAQ